MPATCKASLYCPPMRIFTTSDPYVRTTDDEPMEFRGIILDDTGNVTDDVRVKPVWIPRTLIVRLGTLHWKVLACAGTGEQDGNRVRSELPPEDTHWNWLRFGIIAAPMDAPTFLDLADRRRFEGIVRYPAARLNVLTMTVGELTATGTLTEVK